VFQQVIGAVIGLALIPYVVIGGWINPSAMALIFHP